jgi:hypothetical protein
VLDILLQQKQTARYITQKIYRFLVNEQPDTEKTEWLAERFFKNDYDISKLLDDIFTSDWFYSEHNVGVKIKSPVELIAGIQRMLPMKLENQEAVLVVQRLLGQILFYPPNVAGWPGGKTWIDSSTLMMRMRLPQLINDEDEINVKPKDDDDQMMGNPQGGAKTGIGVAGKKTGANLPKKQQINADVDWSLYFKHLDKVSREKLVDSMSQILLQVKPAVSSDLIRQYSDETARESFIKSATIQIMSTPEYQLC